MLKLSAGEIIEKIKNRKTFEALSLDDSFRIKIEDYTPFICVALHCGQQFEERLQQKCNLSKRERWYEEDPITDQFITSMPVVLTAMDSRYAYDLNRDKNACIYDEAWGKKVWHTPLSGEERKRNLLKHKAFYAVLDTLIESLESLFNACIIYDIHSYNYKRIDRPTPVFNLGTKHIDKNKFGKYIQRWLTELSKIKLPDTETVVAENDVFVGDGYLLTHVTSGFNNTLVLATEIKKIYCNENTGEIFPLMVTAISKDLKKAVINTSAFFARNHTNLTTVKKSSLLSSELDKTILTIDNELFQIVKNFELLSYINPVNIEQEKRAFFKSKFTVNPNFRYRQIVINPFEFKRRLYNVPVEKIRDINIRIMYKDIINAYADKIDLIANIGNDKFLYNSLRYFGEPGDIDVENANFILHCPEISEESNGEDFGAEDLMDVFRKILKRYQIDCRLEISRNIVSKVLVLNNKKTIKIRKDATFNEKELYALAEHEIGVHMLTTVNSRTQPLKFPWLGLPVNTLTQEGLAILSEYLSGNITMKRLRELALRVLAIKHMLRSGNFRKTFNYLYENNYLNMDKAFYLTARIYRGGGLTKDYLYLKGFRDVLTYYKNNGGLEPLLIGKTSVKYASTLKEMIDRKMLLPPRFITHAFESPKNNSNLLEYIIEGIKEPEVVITKTPDVHQKTI